jgi:chromosomal replication initiation ATPase DnaA
MHAASTRVRQQGKVNKDEALWFRVLASQLRLRLEQPASFRREDLIVSQVNAEAVRAIDAWPSWRGGALALVGPHGSGKTHLAALWAERAGAITPTEDDLRDLPRLEGAPVLLEDVDRGDQGEVLFHLINIAARQGGGLLLTARTPPATWRTELPDLASRLKALPWVELGEPDDAVLVGVLTALLRERHIRPTDDLIPYLVRRMERSAEAARDIVARLDEASAPDHRAVNRRLASQVLDFEGDDDKLLE